MYVNPAQEGALLKMLRLQPLDDDDHAVMAVLRELLTERWKWRRLVAVGGEPVETGQDVDGGQDAAPVP